MTEDIKAPDPLMVELFRRVPAPGSHWPIEERALWLSTCEAALNLIYGQVERIDIGAFLPKTPSHAELNAHVEKIAPSGSSLSNEASVLAVLHGEACTCEAGRVEGLFHHPKCPHYVPLVTPEEDRARTIPDEEPRAPYPASSLKNVGGRPSKVRPEGLPSNLFMAVEAIGKLGPASAPQIRKYARDKWWAGMPDHWSACLYDLVGSGKLARQGMNFVVAEAKPAPAPKSAPPEQRVLPKEPAREPMPAVKPTEGPRRPVTPGAKLGPPVRRQNEAEFEYDGRKVSLSSREYMIAVKLRAAIGKGHLSVQFLAETALGADKRAAIDNKSLLKDLCEGMSARLRTVGLTIDYYEGFGFIMKELA